MQYTKCTIVPVCIDDSSCPLLDDLENSNHSRVSVAYDVAVEEPDACILWLDDYAVGSARQKLNNIRTRYKLQALQEG